MLDLIDIGRLPFLNAVCLFATAAIAAWTDWTRWRIPNGLIAASASAALMIAAFYPDSISLKDAMQGGLTGLLLLLPLYLLRGMGAGDVKLMAVLGLHAGLHAVVQIAFLSCLVGGVWSALRLLQRSPGVFACHAWLLRAAPYRRLTERLSAKQKTEPLMWQGSRGSIPYGVVIALAAVTVVVAWTSPVRVLV